MDEEQESYRDKFIGSEEALDAYWGPNQLNRPAYVSCADIIDTGIVNIGSAESPYYHFDCRTSIRMFDCKDRALKTKLFGATFSSPIFAIVKARYETTKEIVYEANPCPRGYIDLRTMEQYYAECCPKALAAEMMV